MKCMTSADQSLMFQEAIRNRVEGEMREVPSM